MSDDDKQPHRAGAATCKRNSVDVLVGRNIRYARRQKGLTVAALAELTAVDERVLREYEAGVCRAGPAALVVLSQALDVKLSHFFRPSIDPMAAAREPESTTGLERLRRGRLKADNDD